jgi:hypothetical protein
MEKVLVRGYSKAMETTAEEELWHYLSCDPDGRQIWCGVRELVELDKDGQVLQRIKLPQLAIGKDVAAWKVLPTRCDEGETATECRTSESDMRAYLWHPRPVLRDASVCVRVGGRSANVVKGIVRVDFDFLGCFIGVVYAGSWEFELLEVRPGVTRIEFSSDLRWAAYTVREDTKETLCRGRFSTTAPHLREEESVDWLGMHWINFVSIYGAVAFSKTDGETTGLFCWTESDASLSRIARYEVQPVHRNYERCHFERRPETSFYIGDGSGNLYRVGTRGSLSCEKVAEFEMWDEKKNDFFDTTLLCFRMMVNTELVPVNWKNVQEFSYHDEQVLLVERMGKLTRLWVLETIRPSQSLVHRCLDAIHTATVVEGAETQRLLSDVEAVLPDDYCRDILRWFERGRLLLGDYEV